MATNPSSIASEILIVDDEADIRFLTAGILEDEGYRTRQAANANEAQAAVVSRRPSLVLLDIWLHDSDLDGLGILDALQRDHPDVPVVMMSGHGTIETAVSAIRKGAYDFIEKPFQADRLLLLVTRAMETARLKRENLALRERTGGDVRMIGQSPPMQQVRQAVERVAQANSRVLVTGPAGSGKEVVARLLHNLSRRSEGPFEVLNCASMDPDRMEIELFGTETAPAPDMPRKVGTFEAADGGTLFLDEVADMPLETQAKIVRVLQDQTFERVGGGTRVEVDVRVVAGSSRNLTEAIRDGRFRDDLFYRLSVVPIDVPPLRERREDIPLLAQYFINQIARAQGQRARHLGDDAMATLQRHDWPGNVRELHNVVERLLIMAPGGPDETIRADMLPADLAAAAPAALGGDRADEMLGLPLRDAREVFEREYLSAQMSRFGGNISRTAEFVGMERSALHRKLKSLGMHGDDRSPRSNR